jgi:hypothetical protein
VNEVVNAVLKHIWMAPIAALVLPIIAFCFVLSAMLGNQVDNDRRAERKRAFESRLPG